MAKRIPSELKDISDRIGDFMRSWGFTKIDGRVWTHLYLSQEPLSAADLMSRLNVSKAMMSLSINELLKYKVIRVARVVKHGTSLYESVDDLKVVVENVLRTREKKMLASLSQSARHLEEKTKSHDKHLKMLSQDKCIKLREMCESAEMLFNEMVLSGECLSAILNFFPRGPGEKKD